MQIQSIPGWRDHTIAGRQYLSTACNGLLRREVFNNELIFQLSAMAIEKFIVGLIQYHHQMPVDHTISGLVAELTSVCPLEKSLADRIRQVEAMDDMCALTVDHQRPPDDDAIDEILAVGRAVAEFVDRHVATENPMAA